jgi:hypothetical protein
MATKVLNTRIVIRNDTAANFERENPTLLKGEIALEIETKKYKVGNGINNYVDLPYYNHIDDGKNNKLNTLISMLDDDEFGSVSDITVNGESVLNKETKVASVTIASISYSGTSQNASLDNLTSGSITLHKIAKTGSWSDLLNKPNVVDNLNSTSSTDILSAKQGNELKKLIQAIPQATSFTSVTNMISTLNGASKTSYNVGHNLYIVERGVPDFWISSVESSAANYTGTATDLINILKNQSNVTVQIGYYKISLLETQKVDLTNYVTTEALNQAIAALGIDELKSTVNSLSNTVGDGSKGLVKDVSDLKTTNSGYETRIKNIEDNYIKDGDFVVLNGGDSKTINS